MDYPFASQFRSMFCSLQGINKVCIPPRQKPYPPDSGCSSAFSAHGKRNGIRTKSAICQGRKGKSGGGDGRGGIVIYTCYILRNNWGRNRITGKEYIVGMCTEARQQIVFLSIFTYVSPAICENNEELRSLSRSANYAHFILME